MSSQTFRTNVPNASKAQPSRRGKSSLGVSGEDEDPDVGRVLALDEDPFAPSPCMGNSKNAGFIDVPSQEAISAPVYEQASMKIRSPFSGSEAADTTPRVATFSGSNGARLNQSESFRSHDLLLTAGHLHSPSQQRASSPTVSLSASSAEVLRSHISSSSTPY